MKGSKCFDRFTLRQWGGQSGWAAVGWPKLLIFSVSLVVLMAIVGCSSIDPSRIESFSLGVTAAKTQTAATFEGVTDLTSDAIIDYAATQPTLNDESVFVVLDPESVAAWNRVFSALEKYSQDLLLLTSANLTKEYKDATVNLAEGIKNTGEKLKDAKLVSGAPDVSAFLSTAFTKLGDLLLRAKAQSDAKRILTVTDPTVREIFVQMADAIDPSGTGHGIRGTVRAHWDQRKGELTRAFLRADGPERRKLVIRYVDLVRQQRTQDIVLSSLRRSFLALADAHHALANGRNVGVAEAISIVQGEVKDTQNLYKRFAALDDDKPK